MVSALQRAIPLTPGGPPLLCSPTPPSDTTRRSSQSPPLSRIAQRSRNLHLPLLIQCSSSVCSAEVERLAERIRAIKRRTQPISPIPSSEGRRTHSSLSEETARSPSHHLSAHTRQHPSHDSSPSSHRTSPPSSISHRAPTPPPSSSPTPAVLSALAALQSRVAQLRLERRLLLAQLEQSKEDSQRREEAAERAAQVAVERERERVQGLMGEEERRRVQWVKEREVWELGLKRREGRVLELRAQLARWEEDFARVRESMEELKRVAAEREAGWATQVTELQQRLDRERRRGIEEGERWVKEREEMQAVVVQQLRELKELSGEGERMARRQWEMRRVVEDAVTMGERWAEVRNSRRGQLDSQLLQCVRQQQELLARLVQAVGCEVDDSERAAREEEEAEVEDEEESLRVQAEVRRQAASRAPLTAKRKSGKGGGHQQAQPLSRSSAVLQPPTSSASVSRTVASPPLPPPLPPRPRSAERPLSARASLSRPSSSSHSRKPRSRSLLGVADPPKTRAAHSRHRAWTTRDDEAEQAAEGERQRSQRLWTVLLESSAAASEVRRVRPRLPPDFIARWGIERSALLSDYKPMLIDRPH